MRYGIIAHGDGDSRYYRSQSAAAREGYNQQAISLCLRGKRQTHRGLVWSHAGPCDRLREYIAIYCQREPNGKPISVSEMLDAYLVWVPPDWRPSIGLEDLVKMEAYGWYWKPTAPQREGGQELQR